MKPTYAIAIAALVIASPLSAQNMYRCLDLGKTIYSDKPCLNGDEVRQIAPNGNPTADTSRGSAEGAGRRATCNHGGARGKARRG